MGAAKCATTRREWYFGLYADAKPGQILGEASVSYARYPVTPDVPARIAADNPDMKIILSVREPVARLKSECLQEIKHRTYAMGESVKVTSLDRYLDETEASPSERTAKIESGEYMCQIERFFDYFPRENVLIVFYDDFRDDPSAFFRSITDFIGVAPLSDTTAERQNMTAGRVETLIAQGAAGRIDRIPLLRSLRKALPTSVSRTARDFLTRLGAGRYEFSPERIAALGKHYAPHNDALRTFTGRALEDWS